MTLNETEIRFLCVMNGKSETSDGDSPSPSHNYDCHKYSIKRYWWFQEKFDVNRGNVDVRIHHFSPLLIVLWTSHWYNNLVRSNNLKTPHSFIKIKQNWVLVIQLGWVNTIQTYNFHFHVFPISKKSAQVVAN